MTELVKAESADCTDAITITITLAQASVTLRALGIGNNRVFDKVGDISEERDGAHETFLRNTVGDLILKEMGENVHFTQVTTVAKS